MTATILTGDCLEVLPTLEAESFDAVVTDVPYSSGGAFRGDRMGGAAKYLDGLAVLPFFTGDNRDQLSWFVWCVMWLSLARRVCRTGALLECFIDWRQLPALTHAVQCSGWVWRGVAVWDKTEGRGRPEPGRLKNQHEFIVWGSNGPLARVGHCAPGVFRLPSDNGRDHPTEKPVPLMEGLLSVLAPGSLVLDPFAGSGSTGAACKRAGLNFVGIEIDAHWAEFSTARMDEEDQAGELRQLGLLEVAQ